MFRVLDPRIQRILKSREYSEPTEPQEESMLPILDGENVLIIAPTGYGKTLAAMLPVFHELIDDEREGMKAIYIAPLKALNRNLLDRLKGFGEKLGVDVQVRHGDTTKYQRRKQALNPPDLLITTPETLQAVMIGKRLKEHLKTLKTVIVDEIHEMVENKRGSQLSIGLERLDYLAGRKLQRIGLSATVGAPEQVSKFLVGNGEECRVVSVMGDKEYDIKILEPETSAEDEALAEELSIPLESAHFLRKIKRMSDDSDGVLVFVNTREMAEVLSSRFKRWLPKYPIAVHHSSLSKSVRLEAEEEFKKGEIKILVCTSSLELGIDIGRIDLILQYWSPRVVAKLIQRVGRSGHGVGRKSVGRVMTSDSDDVLEAKAILDKKEEGWIEPPVILDHPFDVLSHQIMGLCFDTEDPEISWAYELVSKAYPYQNMTEYDFMRVLETMQDARLIYIKDGRIHRRLKSFYHYFESLSMIPDEKNYVVIDEANNRKIGILHEGFVVKHGGLGTVFIQKGEPWRIVDTEDEKIMVVREESPAAAIPSWEGELMPVHYEVAQQAGRLRREELEEQKKWVVPDDETVFLEVFGDHVVIHACFGTKVNNTLGKTLTALLSTELGTSVGLKTDPYRIVIQAPSKEDTGLVVKKFKELKPEWVLPVLKQSLKNATMFSWRFGHVAKRFGVAKKKASLSTRWIEKLVDTYEKTPLVEEAFNEVLNDKMNVPRAEEVVQKMRGGEIQVVVSDRADISPLAKKALMDSSVSEFVKPKEAFKEVMKMVDKRLKETRFSFVCTNCGNQLGSYRVKTIPENLKCPSCGAKTLGFVNWMWDRDKLRVVSKQGELSDEEKKVLKKIKTTATLFLSYGPLACYAIAGKGVGPTTAKRILSKPYAEKEDLLRRIIDAEKTFLRTKKYWAD